jgi:two-component system, NarL family, invasion response regulator UvrY
MKKVLIANDHYIASVGLKCIFDHRFPEFEVTFAQDGDAVYEQVLTRDYDLLIMDANMPKSDGITLLQALLQKKPRLKIIMHTVAAEQMYALRYFKAGARAFLPKNSEPGKVADAIQMVLDGKKYFNKEILTEISSAYFRVEHENPFTKLSNREFEIAAQLVRGSGLPEISQRLNLQKTTVSTYKKRIFEKLNVNNLVDVLNMARQYKFE